MSCCTTKQLTHYREFQLSFPYRKKTETEQNYLLYYYVTRNTNNKNNI